MMQILVITLRESIEAFLIVAITIAYLRKTGRSGLLSPAYWGTATAIALSIVLGVALAEVAVQPLWEGVLAAVAAMLVLGMVIYMLRAAKQMRTTINKRIEAAAQKNGAGAWLGVFGFVLLMITREGMETAFIVNALALKTQSMEMLAGATGGIGLAALVAWAWTRYGHRIRLDLFFQVTSIFLLLFVVQLFIYSFHELSEANFLPIDNEFWHEATEPYGPEGYYGQWLSACLVLVPLAWLAWSWLKSRVGSRAAAV
jgi:high-affinity iron transporter